MKLKSIGAVLAGFMTIVVLHTGTDTILETLDIFPRFPQPFNVTWMVALATAYRSVFGVAGSYMAAAFAPNRPMRHALAIGIIGVVLNMTGAIMIYGPWEPSEFSSLAQQTPAWYSISLTVLALPTAWLGGKLQEAYGKQKSNI